MSKEYLIKEADRVFSIVVRQRYANHEGYVKCATCPISYHWTEITCGHFRKRRHMKTRYNIKNAAPQCSFCNGKDLDVKYFLIDKFSSEEIEEVEFLSHQNANFNEAELREIIREYSKQIR